MVNPDLIDFEMFCTQSVWHKLFLWVHWSQNVWAKETTAPNELYLGFSLVQVSFLQNGNWAAIQVELKPRETILSAYFNHP